MKKTLQLILLSSLFLLFSCGQKKEKKSIFIETNISKDYKINLLDCLEKVNDTVWTSLRTQKNFKTIKIGIKPKTNFDIDASIIELANRDMKEKIHIKTKNIKTNNMKGILSYYKKDNNKGIFPVMSYFVFAIIESDKNLIEFSSESLMIDFYQDMKTSILSLKQLNEVKSSTQKNIKDTLIDVKQAKIDGFQIFEKDNFIIKCPTILRNNTFYLETLKSLEMDYKNINAYIGKLNIEAYDTGTLYNINVTDISEIFNKFSDEQSTYIKESYTAQYLDEIISNNLAYDEIKLKNISCIQYSFMQEDLPTKVLFFVKNKKSYHIQVATRKNLNEKYKNLINSLDFIK